MQFRLKPFVCESQSNAILVKTDIPMIVTITIRSHRDYYIDRGIHIPRKLLSKRNRVTGSTLSPCAQALVLYMGHPL